MKKHRVRYYRDEQTDFFPGGEGYTLPEGYRWVRTDSLSRLLSALVYGAALLFAAVYCPLVLHIRIRGAGKLREAGKSGFFFYGNHTQPVGDVVTPALACFPRRIYTVVSPANYALPGIGRILPYLGALPIPSSRGAMRDFTEAVACRIAGGHPVVVYPEAHVWPYYTGIRPFPSTAFKLPVKLQTPVYCFTVTYQKRRWGKRPAMVVYVDGPIRPTGDSPRAQAQSLRDGVLETMRRRSRENSCAYVTYMREENQ